MIGSYLVGGTASTFFTLRSVTATATVATATLTAANEWGYEPIPAPRTERPFDRRAPRPWSASCVVGRLPVVVELRAGRLALPPAPAGAQHRKPVWAAALRAFHRDPRALSREAS